MSFNKILMSVIVLASVQTIVGCTSKPVNQLGLVPQHRLDLTVPRPMVRPTPRPVRHVTARPTAPTADPWRTNGYRLWRYIVIHHSATARGNAASFDKSHRARGWDELGYHFVIDNGDGGPNGHVEVGGRWTKQKWGAHTGGTPNNEYNNHGIGICLVGEFSSQMPSKAQIAALEKLVRQLASKYKIDPDNIIGHRDGPNAATDCPGAVFMNWVNRSLRPRIRTQLAAAR
ncbi:MAG: peptidoglycan recognition family protein [Phycisphaerae bacterium]|jgi:N-acetyl-anhydromuramyl-L-alanine amidase AmpD|nr:peptidoglycan recognition family protein [Phycisphaerae bacterium]